MKPKLSGKAVKYIRNISPVREIMSFADPGYIRNLGLEPADVISFAGGWVNHKAPAGLQTAYRNIIDDDARFHISGGYPPTLGSSEGRKAIADYEKHLYGIQGLEPGHIAIANSSTQLTYNIFQVLLDPGDSILILDPSYCNIPIQAVMSMENVSILRFPVLNNKAWTYEASEKREEFRDYILEKKPKVILLISPDNPTSQVLTDEFVTAAHEAARETGAYLVIDFAYKELVFQQLYPRYYSWAPDENFLSLHSNSKWSRSLGRRLGWIEGPEEVIAALESFQNASMLCPDMLHQMALSDYFSTALADGSFSKYITETAARYENAAKVTVDMVKEYLGFPVLTPRGGLYTIMDVGENGISFVERVLKNTAVLFVPGWGFGRSMLNAVRISYGPMVENPEKIRTAMERVSKYLKS